MKKPVKDGGHLAATVAKAGFLDFRRVWEGEGNATLREQRKDPHTLLQEDEIEVPDPAPKQIDAVTGLVHRFRTSGTALKLRLSILGFDGKPREGVPCKISVDGTEHKRTTASDGIADAPLRHTSTAAVLTLEDGDSPIEIGRLGPIGEASGRQARLVNLGYLEPPAEEEDGDEERSAIEEFQVDHDLPVTGEMDEATAARLEEVHGC